MMNPISNVTIKLVETGEIKQSNVIHNDNQAIRILCNEIGDNDRETFAVLCLDTKGNILNFSISHIGTLNQSLIHNREIFKVAILCNANSIIVGHNHPSGELTPSIQDIEYTKNIVKAGELLGVAVLDHIVVNTTTGVSMRGINPKLFKE